jgi:hypothetical protein
MSDLDPLRYFLGIEISSTSERFFSSQEILLIKLFLLITGLLRLPWSSIFTLHPLMMSLLRVLLVIYLSVTRPDISYSVHILSQFISTSTQIHYSHLFYVMCYLHRTIFHRLFFPRSTSLQLQTYYDATSASDPSDHRFISDYYVF